jgi:two-component system, sensor histidine kinase and response regulator
VRNYIIFGFLIGFGLFASLTRAQDTLCVDVFNKKLNELEAIDSLKAHLYYFDCLMSSDPVSARDKLQVFLNRQDVQASPLILLESRFRIASLYSGLSELEKALLAFDTLYTLAEDNEDYYRMSLAKVNQGITYRRMSQFGKSMEAYDLAMQAARKGKAKALEASIYMNRGSLLNAMQLHAEALENLHESYRLHHELKSERGKAMVAANMGISLKNLGQTDSAIYYYELSATSFKTTGDNYNLAKMYSNIGQLYDATGEYQKAHIHLDLAIEMMEKQENYIDLVNTLNAKSAAFIANQTPRRAITYAQKAATLAQEQDYWLGARNALEYLALAAADIGDYKTAYEAQFKSKVYHDSIYSDEQQTLVAEMQAKFESEKKDLELLTKDEQLEFQQSKLFYSYYILALLGILIAVLALYFLRIRRLNQKLEHQQLALSEKNEALKQMDDFKNRLLTIVSHDVRNPLTGLKGILSLQASGAITEAELLEWNVDVTKRIDLALGMLENLLEWSKIQLVGLKPYKEKLMAELFMRELVEQLQFQAAQKGVNIKWQVEPGLGVIADRHMLRIAMYNLLNNAIKFSNRNDTVTVNFSKAGKEVVISLADQGVGMSPEQVAKALNRHEIFTTYGTENEKGTGVGLLLTHEFIRLMEGRIEIESEVGKGSTFRICIPD